MARSRLDRKERRQPGRIPLSLSFLVHVGLGVWLILQVVLPSSGAPEPRQAKIGPDLLPAVEPSPPEIDPPSEEPADEEHETDLVEPTEAQVEVDELIPAPWRPRQLQDDPVPEPARRMNELARNIEPRERPKQPEAEPVEASAPALVEEAPPAPRPEPFVTARKAAGSCPPPPYPRQALRHRLEGRVVLLVDIGADGHIRDLEIQTSSGHRILDRAAADAVRNWRFRPATRAGIPQPDRLRIPITFKLP